jgi:polysaccharide biosynthesis/export protein
MASPIPNQILKQLSKQIGSGLISSALVIFHLCAAAEAQSGGMENLPTIVPPSVAPPVIAPILTAPTQSTQPQPTQPQPTQLQPTQLQPEDYLLGAGDQVRVDVFRIPEYSGEYEVLVNGVLNLPMVGQVAVAGLTLEQATAAISQAYAQRLRRPIINVFLINPRPLRVGIVGEVSRPGEYILQRDGTQFPSLISALEAAGGITQSANLRQLAINRTAGNGSQQTIIVDLWQFLETGSLSHNVALRDGDTVFIPTQTSFSSSESIQLAAASFAADESRPLNVAVVGEVFRPGPYTVSGAGQTNESDSLSASSTLPTVTRAIQVAGGIQPEANIREVKVYRRTRDGTEQVIDVNLWKLLREGSIVEDIALQEGDTVYIPQAVDPLPEEVSEVASASFSPGTIRVNIVGEVATPGVVEVAPNTPLSQGVLAAGGFNNRASTGVVELVRLNVNGTASRSSLPVDFSQGIDEATNPLLRNNDTIIVRRSASARVGDVLDTFVGPLGKVFSLFTIPTSIFGLFD